MATSSLEHRGRTLRALLLLPIVFAVGALSALGASLVSADGNENPSSTMQPLMSAGGQHTCAIVDGAAKCWGLNFYGALGDGTNGSLDPNPDPVQVTGLTSNVTIITSGLSHTCAIVGGAAKCWGYNVSGQLGDGTTTDKNTPAQVTGLTSNVTAISAGRYHTCAIVGGAAKCWGSNFDGQLGDGTTADKDTPVQVTGLTAGVTAISAGGNHTCAIVSGAAKCWGANDNYELGNGSDEATSSAVQVNNLTSNVTAISAGRYHTCAVVGGAAKCWGYNVFGRLGDGTSGDRDSPAPVTGLTAGVTAISAGDGHTCAIVGGAAKCWGLNSWGQIGDGTITSFGVTITSNRLSPVDVDGLTNNVTAISSGGEHTCAIVGDAAKCWGNNYRGQLGRSDIATSLTPVNVTGFETAFVTTTTTPATVVLPPALPALVNAPVATTTTAAPPDTAPPTEPPTTTAPTDTSPTPTEAPTTTVPAPALSVISELPAPASPIVTESSIIIGEPITVSFGGFTPFEFVQLIVASTPQVIGSGYADAQGVVTISGALPYDLSGGTHTLAVYAPGSGVGFAQPITVASPSLPATGSTTGNIGAIVALSVLLAGIGAIVTARRRIA